MASKLQVYNMALSAARSQGNLKALTQVSRDRTECDTWYELVLDVVQEAAYWPCCKVQVELSDETEEDDREYLYSYELPPDYLRAWYLTNWGRFSVESTTAGVTRIYADCQDAKLVYAKQVINPERWTPAMLQAIVYGLGYKVCETLTSNDALVERLLGLANSYLVQAQATSLMGGGDNRLKDSDPDWIRARTDSGGVPRGTRFYHPFGDVWANAS